MERRLDALGLSSMIRYFIWTLRKKQGDFTEGPDRLGCHRPGARFSVAKLVLVQTGVVKHIHCSRLPSWCLKLSRWG